MGLMLSVHFSRAFLEIFLPNVNNRAMPLDIPRDRLVVGELHGESRAS